MSSCRLACPLLFQAQSLSPWLAPSGAPLAGCDAVRLMAIPSRSSPEWLYYASFCRRGQDGGPCRSIGCPVCQRIRSAIAQGYRDDAATIDAISKLRHDMPLLRFGDSWSPYPRPLLPPPPAGGGCATIRGTAVGMGAVHAPGSVTVVPGYRTVSRWRPLGPGSAHINGGAVLLPPPPAPPAGGHPANGHQVSAREWLSLLLLPVDAKRPHVGWRWIVE